MQWSWQAAVTAGGRLSYLTQAWSTDVPGLSAMQGMNRQATGLASVTVHGASMGKMAYICRAREGHTGCEATEWVSDTSIKCQVGQGVQGSRRAVVTAGGQSGSVTHTWSTDVPGSSAIQIVNRDPLGSTWVTVHGAGMGIIAYTGRAREGHSGCEATEWASETSVRCLVTHTGRRTQCVVVTAGMHEGSMMQAWSLDLASISLVRWINRAGIGSLMLTVHGASMGQVTYTGKVRVGHTGCEATEWASETSMRCKVSQFAFSGSQRGVMTGRGATRERDTGMVGRFHCCGCDATTESCCDRIGVRDDTRGEHGACNIHEAGTGGAHGMRGDRLGDRDIYALFGVTRSSRISAYCADYARAARKRNSCLVGQ